MQRARVYRRWQRQRVIAKKVHILRQYGGEAYVFAWSRGQNGHFAKGKIHCSCWMCRRKSYDFLSHGDSRKLAAWQQLQQEQ